METDYNFIMSTWLKGLHYGCKFFSYIDRVAFFTFYHKVVTSLMARDSVEVRVLCLKDEPDVILSYAVLEHRGSDLILHYIFTKTSWRKLGFASKLLDKKINIFTHYTDLGKSITDEKIKKKNLDPDKLIFNPFLV